MENTRKNVVPLFVSNPPKWVFYPKVGNLCASCNLHMLLTSMYPLPEATLDTSQDAGARL